MRAEAVVHGSGVPMGALARLKGASGWLRRSGEGDSFVWPDHFVWPAPAAGCAAAPRMHFFGTVGSSPRVHFFVLYAAVVAVAVAADTR